MMASSWSSYRGVQFSVLSLCRSLLHDFHVCQFSGFDLVGQVFDLVGPVFDMSLYCPVFKVSFRFSGLVDLQLSDLLDLVS